MAKKYVVFVALMILILGLGVVFLAIRDGAEPQQVHSTSDVSSDEHRQDGLKRGVSGEGVSSKSTQSVVGAKGGKAQKRQTVQGGAQRPTGQRSNTKVRYRAWQTLVKAGASDSNDQAPKTDREGPAGRLPMKALNGVMQAFVPKAMACFREASRDVPDGAFDGMLIMRGQINQNESGAHEGQLTRIQVAEESTLNDDLFAQCLAKQMAELKFPRPEGGTWAEQTFRFKVPRKAKK